MKNKKSISKRIKITKNGKVTRRAMGLGHSKGNKSNTQKTRRKSKRGLATYGKLIQKKYL